MSFAAAGRLWLLAVPVVFAAAYVVLQVQRRRVRARFTDEVMLPSVAPVRPPWQRHVAALLLVLALTVMTLGFAGPRTVKQTPRKSAIVVFAIDTSLSMAATDLKPTRLDAARTATHSLIAALPAGFRVGVVTFGSVPQLLIAPTLDRNVVDQSLTGLVAAHGTATGRAMQLALQAVKDTRTSVGQLAATIVLISDGQPSVGLPGQTPQQSVDAEAAAAKAADVRIHTVAAGGNGGAAMLASVARETGGLSFRANDTAQLASIYRGLGTVISRVKRVHDYTAVFTGAALAVACLAGAAALAWSSRLVP